MSAAAVHVLLITFCDRNISSFCIFQLLSYSLNLLASLLYNNLMQSRSRSEAWQLTVEQFVVARIALNVLAVNRPVEVGDVAWVTLDTTDKKSQVISRRLVPVS